MYQIFSLGKLDIPQVFEDSVVASMEVDAESSVPRGVNQFCSNERPNGDTCDEDEEEVVVK